MSLEWWALLAWIYMVKGVVYKRLLVYIDEIVPDHGSDRNC